MKAEQIRALCLSLPNATEQVQWEKDLVFKIGGKMFACMGMEADSRYSFKCSDAAFQDLTQLPGVVPAPYLARAKWIQIDPHACELGTPQLELLVRESYRLVFEKLPRRLQAELATAGS